MAVFYLYTHTWYSESDLALGAGLLRRVTAIPDLEVTGDEAAQLRLATAFNFPAVLASAGQEEWPQLRPAHGTLLQDRDPAVRRTLACSLHEIAALLGPDQALQDLGPAIQVSAPLPWHLALYLSTEVFGCIWWAECCGSFSLQSGSDCPVYDLICFLLLPSSIGWHMLCK